MKDQILAGGLILLGILTVLGIFIGIPILKDMNKPLIVSDDPFMHKTAAEGYISPECRQKMNDASKLIEPLKTAQNAANDQISAIVSRNALAQPINTTEPADKYLYGSDKAQYDSLSKQYFDLGNQIDAIQLRYACN